MWTVITILFGSIALTIRSMLRLTPIQVQKITKSYLVKYNDQLIDILKHATTHLKTARSHQITIEIINLDKANRSIVLTFPKDQTLSNTFHLDEIEPNTIWSIIPSEEYEVHTAQNNNLNPLIHQYIIKHKEKNHFEIQQKTLTKKTSQSDTKKNTESWNAFVQKKQTETPQTKTEEEIIQLLSKHIQEGQKPLRRIE